MKCPFCEAKDTKVLDSRNLQDGSTVRRRRKCESCDKRFTTYEHFEIDMPLVVKNDGRRENYNRDKLSGGIEKACQKRPISTTQIEHVITNVEKAIMDISNKEIRSRDIGSLVMMYMKNLDPVAYVRFASVYMNFHDVDEFVKDIKRDESFINSSLVNQVDISQFQSEQ
jgi:transcriptional repressor NrdR